VVSVTDAGAALAGRLPYEHRHGRLGDAVRELWDGVDRLVLVAATGIAVRVIAPLLSDKHHDPPVVCLDDGGRWAIALAGGHHGANALAREVAALVGAEPVVTTATEAAGLPALDDLPGFRTTGDVAAVTRAWLDGAPPLVDHTDLPHWPLPAPLAALADPPAATDPDRPGTPAAASPPVVPARSPATSTSIPVPGAPEGEVMRSPAGPAQATGSPAPAGLVTDPAVQATAGEVARRPADPTEDAESPEPAVRVTDRAAEATAGEVPRPAGRTEVTGSPAPVGQVTDRAVDGATGEQVRQPAGPTEVAGKAVSVVRVTDRAIDDAAGEVVLRPGSLVVGVGSSSGADPAGIAELVASALAAAGLSPAAVGLVASVDLKRDEAGIVALAGDLGVALRTFPAESLAAVAVPTPSPIVEAAVGTPSVAEAAALLAAGPGADLVIAKQRSSEATVAVARRARPEGHLAVVGLGPGDPAWRTPAAAAAVRGADVVIGYGLYVDLAADLLGPHHEVVRSPIGAETDRCSMALERASAGQRVALVCSGDPGVFAMASLVCELAPAHGDPPTAVVPGVTAAYGAAAVLGAPLGHDHAMVSLSDLLTPWELIERRVAAVAEGDLAVAFYNPRSQRRTWQLGRAVELLAAHRPADCPVAVVSDVGRAGRQRIVRTTLARFDPAVVDMLSLVIVGSSTTRWQAGTMVTPRGYPTAPDPDPAPAPTLETAVGPA
jgi:cobalt-precorrin 5A hydrolase/precorrin-3B C17-methyltransferase